MRHTLVNILMASVLALGAFLSPAVAQVSECYVNVEFVQNAIKADTAETTPKAQTFFGNDNSVYIFHSNDWPFYIGMAFGSDGCLVQDLEPKLFTEQEIWINFGMLLIKD